MTTIENTFLRDLLGSIFHHLAGIDTPTSDADCIEVEGGTMKDTFIEYCRLNNNKRKRFAIADYKRQCNAINFKKKPQTVSMAYDGMQLQKELAEDLNLPFFVYCTYLSDEYNIKMYFILAMNTLAEDFFIDNKYDINGEWMTLKEHSIFQHQLRGKTFNPLEPIQEEHRMNAFINMPDCLTLGDLPNIKAKYQKPFISYE